MSVRLIDHELLAITGYTDRLSARPGEAVQVHASSVHSDGWMRLVRLGHDGAEFTKEEITSPQPIALQHQSVVLGSYGVVGSVDIPSAPFEISMWVWLSRTPEDGENALLAATGCMTFKVSPDCSISLGVGGDNVTSDIVLQLRRWYHVAAGVDANSHIFVSVKPQRPTFGEEEVAYTATPLTETWTPKIADLVFGRDLDGKLEDFCIVQGVGAEANELLRLDFSIGIPTWKIHDTSGSVIGQLKGLPTRGVRGHLWDGSQHEWRHAPEQYAAIHFRSDDQGDQCWSTTAVMIIPEDLASGVYAIELAASDAVDHLPIAVRPRCGEKADLLLLLPTVSYLTYSYEHYPLEFVPFLSEWKCPELAMEFANANGYHSLYDEYRDGSRVFLVSSHRPLLGMRPDHRYRIMGCEHQLSADLHLLGWLSRQGFCFDVITDHDLDAEGGALLKPYRAVMTGHHPEYWTSRMYDGLESYLEAGGNLAYLGGNGFRFTAAIDKDASVLEVRRNQSSTHEGQVGEEHYQLTGAPGGHWLVSGRPENALVGVSWACTGLEGASAYHRTPASFDPRVAHLFEGIGDDEVIGEKGAFLGAAASLEVDFANKLLGTPQHALTVASAAMPVGPSGYFIVPHRILKALKSEDDKSRRRADLTYFETRDGGAVFSVGSMGWIGALSEDGDANAVSQLTRNALQGFLKK